MSWKMTVVFALLLGIALAVYFFRPTSSGVGAAVPGSPANKLFPDLISDRVDQIEILRQGETSTALERAVDSVGDYWRIAPPVDKPADLTLVREMLASVDRFVKTGGMEPGRPETGTPVTGLDQPRIVVTFHGRGQKETIRFGKQPPTNSSVVFFQKEGDPMIYLAAQEIYAAFDKAPLSLRQKMLLRMDPHRAVKVQIERKFIHVKQGQPPVTEYESSTLERLEGSENGWWLTKPHRERMDDLRVMNLVMELAAMPIEDWRLAGNLKAQGFDQPAARISVWRFGEEKPVTVLFGDLDPDLKTKRFVHVLGSGEVTRIEALRFDNMPVQRNHFRPIHVFPFSRDLVRELRLEARDGSKVVIERREVKQGEISTTSWDLLEPKDVKIEKDQVEVYVAAIVALQIAKNGFLGPLKPEEVGLKEPELLLTLTTRDGKKHVCQFWSGSTDLGYMRREGVDELFGVSAEIVRKMKRMELDLLQKEVFNVPRASLKEFTFESRPGVLLKPVYYTVRFNAEEGKWRFVAPPGMKGKEAQAGIVGDITVVMNYVQATEFIGRDAATAKEYGLTKDQAPSTLTVVHENGTAVFYISTDQSEKSTYSKYYARREGNPVVFQMSSPFVRNLTELMVRSMDQKPGPEEKKPR